MDKKETFSYKDNIVKLEDLYLQAMQNLPSVTVQDGKVQLRGNDKVTVLIDGKQNSHNWFFGEQTGLDNIPASAIER
jgi:homospermidine synthase